MRRFAAILTLSAAWSGTAIARAAETQNKADSGTTLIEQKACNCGDDVCPKCGKGVPWGRHAQSGYGLWVAPWAVPTGGPDYKSYYVGGSKLPWRWARKARPEPRFPWEGTWGTDYVPALTRVELWWTHGRLDQDGGGQYEPDHRNRPFGLKYGKEAAER